MGKKAKTAAGVAKASQRKVDKAELPPPPKPPHEEYGSSKTVEKPSLPGDHKILGEEVYDDGGVGDLSLIIDLDDNVQRRRRGDSEYFSAAKANLLPRVTRGPLGLKTRRDQKIHLAQILFGDSEDAEERSPSEVYVDVVDGQEDQATLKHRRERWASARGALTLSLLLREPACVSVSLSEICKRRLTLFGKAGAEDALRCADKAIQVAGDGFYDNDEVAVEAEEFPVIDNKHEVDPTTPGLANPAMLKLLPIRVSHLCVRSALLQRGNALSALGRDDEARETYESVWPLLEKELRCARVDWERHSLHVNIGNTYCRQGDYAKAHEQYKLAEEMGQQYLDEGPDGPEADAVGMLLVAKRAKAFALKKEGKEDEAKELLKEVITLQLKKNKLEEEKKKKEAEQAKKDEEEAAKKALEEAASNPASP